MTPQVLMRSLGHLLVAAAYAGLLLLTWAGLLRPLDNGLTIEPGKTVKLAPGGYHLMLMDLKQPFKQGDKVPLTLEFEKAGKVAVALDVQAVGAQSPSGGDTKHDHK